ESWLAGRKVLMLEPRRIAARAAARRMASTLRESVGETVGYRIRRETRIGVKTRIEVVTEGILTRMLIADPALEEAGLLIFDEFHERNLVADLGLALALESQALVRPDLRLLIMSATLDGAAVSTLLGAAPVITSEGRSFPVETRYRPPRPDQRLEPALVPLVREALGEPGGDVLVFLPGAGEIHRTRDLLADAQLGGNVDLVPLYGQLTGDAQDRALEPATAGRRKVVLATSIAETSLTIEGVTTVIDGGWSRVPRYSPASGMSRLVTVRVTRASADQRRGRAGRLGPGICYRLWAAAEDAALIPRSTPEILEADLTPLALDLAAAGIADPATLRWLDLPPAAALAEARKLLTGLEALDAEGRITPHGKALAGLGMHPRLGHLLLESERLGEAAVGAALTALLEERDPMRGDGPETDPDLRLRVDLVLGGERSHGGGFVNHDLVRRIRQEARARFEQLGAGAWPKGPVSSESTGLLLSFAYPDRIGQRRPGQAGRFLLSGGQGASTSAPSLALADWIVAADLDGDRRESRIWRAAPVTLAELERHHADVITTGEEIEWDESAGAVAARRVRRLGAVTLEEKALHNPDPGRVSAVLLAAIARDGIEHLPWTEEATRLRQRLAFLHALDGSWPDVSDDALRQTIAVWLGPRLSGIRRRDQLSRIELVAALLDLLSWEQRAALDNLAPSHLPVPSGSRIAVDYSDPTAPVLAVRLQEVFGLSETPRVGGGKVPVVMHLLSPARRPVQVTRDLAGFWRSTYFEVKKDLKGRYPRHYWPDDPLVAEPTRRVRPHPK
ncbi:MAG TPA: ATP-dependent helicase HrpB, partial [Gemmatimonadales bacterium]|nr:ATP-dependent helicase HrpB [Gemmatimonadales bacterium]